MQGLLFAFALVSKRGLAAVAVLLWAVPHHAADLEVVLEGIHSADGQALVAVHQEHPDAAFPSAAGVVANAARPATKGTMTFHFGGLAPGEYAVAAFHDANGDGELNANFVGMPTEGYGFSNGARGFMGPPSFAKAAVSVGDAETTRIVVAIGSPESPQ